MMNLTCLARVDGAGNLAHRVNLCLRSPPSKKMNLMKFVKFDQNHAFDQI